MDDFRVKRISKENKYEGPNLEDWEAFSNHLSHCDTLHIYILVYGEALDH